MRFNIMSQRRPTDPFLQIPVLQENVCWLGDVEEMTCPWKESVAGKKVIQGLDRIADMFYLSETFPPAHTISSPPLPQ